jgi:SNF2 family DNA or RNA helicase
MADKPKLRDYQKAGVAFMLEAGVTYEGRSIVSDDMGLGKTPQAIIAAKLFKAYRTLVVCPKTLRWNWEAEIRKWLPKAPVVVADGTREQKLATIREFEKGFLIVNLDFVRATTIPSVNDPTKKLYRKTEAIELLLSKGFHFFILDEGHRCSNKDSLQARGATFLAHGIPYFTALTGSPFRGRVTNIWSLLHMADKKKWSSFWKFAGKHANAHQGLYGWEMQENAVDAKALEREIAPVFIQRRKEDHLDLPPITHQEVWVKMEGRQKAVYEEMEEEMMATLTDGTRIVAPIIVAKIMRLKQIALAPILIDPTRFPIEFDPFIKDGEEMRDEEYAETYMDGAKFRALRDILLGTEEKVIVFSQFEKAIQCVADLCKRNGVGCVTYTGNSRDTKTLPGGRTVRDNNEHLWKYVPGIQVMAATTQAGGLGLNWTQAGVMVRLDKMWVPDDNDQARDRMHRFGQDKPTLLIDLLTLDTIEQWVEKVLDFRTNVNEEILRLVRERMMRKVA